MTRKIAVILGSLRNNSNSERLARAIAAEAPKNLAFDIIPIGDLPFYNQDIDNPEQIPAAARELLRERPAPAPVPRQSWAQRLRERVGGWLMWLPRAVVRPPLRLAWRGSAPRRSRPRAGS